MLYIAIVCFRVFFSTCVQRRLHRQVLGFAGGSHEKQERVRFKTEIGFGERLESDQRQVGQADSRNQDILAGDFVREAIPQQEHERPPVPRAIDQLVSCRFNANCAPEGLFVPA